MKRAALTLATLACIAQSVPIATAQETIRIGERSPYLIRTFFAIPQLCRPMAPYAIKNNLKRIFVVVADFAPGHECEKVFGTAFIQAQGTILGNLRIPLKNPEFAGYMQRIRDAKPEALLGIVPHEFQWRQDIIGRSFWSG
ncbi:MAG: ABC transporter substrate-binding protein [Burkholderiales bacterium]